MDTNANAPAVTFHPVILTVPAFQLRPNDVIHFGGDLVFVVGVDPAADRSAYLDGSPTISLVTQDETGGQFIDYIEANRTFTVVRHDA